MESTLSVSLDTASSGENFEVIKFVGEFDKAGHTDVKEELEKMIKAFDKSFLVFDFSALKFINSEGIGYLMEVHAHLMKSDKKLVIVGVNDHVSDVFETIGVQEIIALYPSLSDFKNKIS